MSIIMIITALLAMVAAGAQVFAQQTLAILTITLAISHLAFCVEVAGTTTRLSSALRVATASTPRTGAATSVAAPSDRATDLLNN